MVRPLLAGVASGTSSPLLRRPLRAGGGGTSGAGTAGGGGGAATASWPGGCNRTGKN